VADAVAHTACPTPTACAQMLVARVEAFDQGVAERATRLAGAGAAHLARHADGLAVRADALSRGGRRNIDASTLELSRKALRLSPLNLGDRLLARRDLLAGAAARLLAGSQRTVNEAARTTAGQLTQLRAHAPERVLARGYSLTRTAGGDLVTDAAALTAGDVLSTTFARGAATSVITATTPAAGSDDSSGEDR
jgi:exodeoxyribonuclease VII large subunit